MDRHFQSGSTTFNNLPSNATTSCDHPSCTRAQSRPACLRAPACSSPGRLTTPFESGPYGTLRAGLRLELDPGLDLDPDPEHQQRSPGAASLSWRATPHP